MDDLLAQSQQIAREHEVKLLVDEAVATAKQAGVLWEIAAHRPYAVVQIACLDPVTAYVAEGLVTIEQLFVWLDVALCRHGGEV